VAERFKAAGSGPGGEVGFLMVPDWARHRGSFDEGIMVSGQKKGFGVNDKKMPASYLMSI
jgi:hypothetical protein